jgi:hypothetical protein
MFKSAAALVLLVIAPTVAAAQTITDERLWVAVSAQDRLGATSDWRWFVDVIARSRNGVDDLDATALRGAIGVDLSSHTSVAAGYAAAQSYPSSGGVTLEHRIFAQAQWRGRPAGGSLAFRTRLEQRRIEGNSGAAWRVREQVRFSHAVAPGSRVSVVTWDEVFFHANATRRYARGLDQNRAFVGLGVALDAHAGLDVGYLNQFSRSRSGPDRVNHILSVTLALTF